MLTKERERRDATEDEIENLRHVVDSLPFIVWIALMASGAERFTFYAVTTPWRELSHCKEEEKKDKDVCIEFLTCRKLHAVPSG